MKTVISSLPVKIHSDLELRIEVDMSESVNYVPRINCKPCARKYNRGSQNTCSQAFFDVKKVDTERDSNFNLDRYSKAFCDVGILIEMLANTCFRFPILPV